MWRWTLKSPGEIKRTNVELDSQESRRDKEEECGDGLSRFQARSRGRIRSWTLKIPGEMKSREVELDSQVNPGEIKSREMEPVSHTRMVCLAAELFLNSYFSDTM